MEKPTPAFSHNNVPVVFAANDYYVPYMATTIFSIMKNSSINNNYDFVILTRNITDENKSLLNSMLNKFPNSSMRIINVGEYTAGFSFFTSNREDFSEEAYYRLLIPEIMSAYEKVIYLDGDMVALVDVADLYSIELGGSLLASSRDLCGLMSYYNPLEDRKAYRDRELGLKNPNDYFISGMLVFNIPHFRATYSCEYLLQFAASKEWFQHDQDVLNVLCEGKTKLISASWDVIKPELFQYLPPRYRKELDESIENPKIIHYGGVLKPWINLDTPFSNEFWSYAAQTPFIQEIIRRRIYLDREPYSVRATMEEEFRQGKVGARYILKFVRAWLSFKMNRRNS